MIAPFVREIKISSHLHVMKVWVKEEKSTKNACVWHYLDLKDTQGEAVNRIKREERREWLRHVLFEFHL